MSAERLPVETTQPAREPVRRASVYLQPGQLFVSREPAEAVTVLGSCVAICLFDEQLGIGGANHYLLPHWSGPNAGATTRYGNVATATLIRELRRLGCETRDLKAKLFGGATVLEAFRERANHLGSQNVELARRALEAAGIPVVAKDVGGNRGRKMIFRTDTGEALVRLL